ncbi:hypothetical protein [Streptomyces sp. B93]|uniref:hypothetical protein n=1 Tax=Streptomyces sp. B93 TaxID=2824875 RepID=UPI001B398CEC|nr:hypothetical protein [Streptomyces sp. B93]MBQ1092225.1 hypothetical protein [Streptomyces sp. B93]
MPRTDSYPSLDQVAELLGTTVHFPPAGRRPQTGERPGATPGLQHLAQVGFTASF